MLTIKKMDKTLLYLLHAFNSLTLMFGHITRILPTNCIYDFKLCQVCREGKQKSSHIRFWHLFYIHFHPSDIPCSIMMGTEIGQ